MPSPGLFLNRERLCHRVFDTGIVLFSRILKSATEFSVEQPGECPFHRRE